MSDVDKKVAHIKQKTEEARAIFNLPESEPVIQDYSCSFSHTAGRLYITPNYVLFAASIGSTSVRSSEL